MDFQSLVDNLLSDTLRVSLPLFRPELAICATIVVMLLVRLFNWGQKIDPFWLALVGSLVAFLLRAARRAGSTPRRQSAGRKSSPACWSTTR